MCFNAQKLKDKWVNHTVKRADTLNAEYIIVLSTFFVKLCYPQTHTSKKNFVFVF